MKFYPTQGGFELPPEGESLGVCDQVLDLGTSIHLYRDGGKGLVRTVQFMFETEHRRSNGIRHTVMTSFWMRPNLGEKDKLRLFLEDWDGTRYTNGQVEAIDAKSFLRKSALLTLKRNGEYTNIVEIRPAGKMTLTCEEPVLYLDLDDVLDNEVLELIQSLPAKTRAKIEQSPEYSKALGLEIPAEFFAMGWGKKNGSGPASSSRDLPDDPPFDDPIPPLDDEIRV